MAKLLKHLSVLPTLNRVFSIVDAHHDHSSGASCWFRSGDGCLMNPQILNGVDKVLITSANEIEYFDGVFPLIQTGPGHFLVDERDLRVRPKLGHRPAVAVERRTDDEFAIVIAGDACRDTVETLGGLLHGFDENQQLMVRLVDHLSASASSIEKNRYKAHLYSINWNLN